MTEIEELRDVIHKLHGATATHVESDARKEVFRGQTVWDGVVEVFDLRTATPRRTRPTHGRTQRMIQSIPGERYGAAHPAAISPRTAVRAAIVRGTEMPTQPKPKKVGRPKLPKEAKGKAVQVRFDADDLKLVTAASKAQKQNVSEWIRDTVRTAAEVYLFQNTLHDAMRTVLLQHPERKATTSELSDEIAKRNLYHRKDGETARASQINARRREVPPPVRH